MKIDSYQIYEDITDDCGGCGPSAVADDIAQTVQSVMDSVEDFKGNEEMAYNVAANAWKMAIKELGSETRRILEQDLRDNGFVLKTDAVVKEWNPGVEDD